MKNLLRKAVTIITCAVVLSLSISPFTVSAKTPSTVYEDASKNYKYFAYSDPLFFTQADRLANNVNTGFWHVEAGGRLSYTIHFLVPDTFRILVTKSSGPIVYDQTVNTMNASFSYLIYESGDYNIIIIPASTTPAIIDWFCVDID